MERGTWPRGPRGAHVLPRSTNARKSDGGRVLIKVSANAPFSQAMGLEAVQPIQPNAQGRRPFGKSFQTISTPGILQTVKASHIAATSPFA